MYMTKKAASPNFKIKPDIRYLIHARKQTEGLEGLETWEN